MSGENDLRFDSLDWQEEHFRALINHLNIGIFRINAEPGGRFVHANPALAAIFGYDSVDELMRVKALNLFMNSKQRRLFLKNIDSDHQVKNKEFLMQKKNGRPVWAIIFAHFQYDSDKHLLWIDGMVENVTEQKEMLEELEFHKNYLEEIVVARTQEVRDGMKELAQRTEELETVKSQMELAFDMLDSVAKKLHATLNAKGIAELLMSEAQKYFEFTDVSVLIYNEGTGYLEFLAAREQVDIKQIRFAPGEGIAGNVFLSGKPEIINDTSQDMRFVRRLTNPPSIMVIPIKSKNKTIGVINFSHNYPMNYQEENLKWFNILVSLAGIAMDNALLYQDLETKVEERTRELEEERAKLSQRNREMEDELEMARRIQMQFIPHASPFPNVAFYYKSMELVGGDFFAFVEFTTGHMKGKQGIFLSDVSGHGVPAAFISSMVNSFTLQFAELIDNPAEFLTHLNDFLGNQGGGNFVTAFYCIYDPQTCNLVFSNAGHYPPYLIRDNKVTQIEYHVQSFPLAILPNSEMTEMNRTYRNQSVDLLPKDKVIFYTDGLTETVNIQRRRDPFSNERIDFEAIILPKVLYNNRKLPAYQLVSKITKELIRFRGAESFEDDVCVICLEVEQPANLDY